MRGECAARMFEGKIFMNVWEFVGVWKFDEW